MKTKVAIVGFGVMGRAMSEAILKGGRDAEVFGIDKNDINSSKTAKRTKNIKNIKKSDFIILAVKPQNAREAIEEIKSHISKNSILISIMAGVPLKKLISLSRHKKIIRMMPNLGLSVGEGVAAWKGAGLSKLEAQKAKNFLNKISYNFEVKNENAINKVTAISGSGPAYFFLLADCLVKACGSLGLGKDESLELVEKTFSAAATLGKGSDYPLLMKKVASKGGTTEAALKVFQKRDFNGIVTQAVRAAYKRANELSKENE
jgi:pyrroline-5-carboxylate reductase